MQNKGKQAITTRYARLFALGDEKMTAINNMLAHGLSGGQIAKKIQQDWKEFEDVKESTLIQQISRYKHDTKVVEVTAPEIKAMPVIVDLHKFDAVAEAIAMLRIQKTRIDALISREQSINVPMNMTRGDIETFMTMLQQIQKLRFDLGLDVFAGPIMHGGRMVSQQIITPDGTTVTTQISEAVNQALTVLEKYQKKDVIEGEYSEPKQLTKS